MGLFVLSQSDEPEDLIQSALDNLKLWQSHRADYLIDNFAITQLHNALLQLNKMKVNKN